MGEAFKLADLSLYEAKKMVEIIFKFIKKIKITFNMLKYSTLLIAQL